MPRLIALYLRACRRWKERFVHKGVKGLRPGCHSGQGQSHGHGIVVEVVVEVAAEKVIMIVVVTLPYGFGPS